MVIKIYFPNICYDINTCDDVIYSILTFRDRGSYYIGLGLGLGLSFEIVI